MQSNPRIPLPYLLLLIWLSTCIAFFLYISRVGFVQIVEITSLESFTGMLSHIMLFDYFLHLFKALIGILFFSLASLSVGLRILQKWEQLQPSKPALAITAFLLGEIIFSLISLSVISLYRLTPEFVAILIASGLLIGLPALKTFTINVLRHTSLSTTFDIKEKVILGLVVISLVLGLSLSSTRLGYDATAEYFSHSKIMAVSQSPIFFYFTDSFVVSSLHPGILVTMIIQLFGDQSARLLSWVNGIIILLLGLLLGSKVGLTQRAGLWFLALMVSSTAFIDLFGDGKIELITTAPTLAAVYWLIDNLEKPTMHKCVLIGFLAGFSIISRPYNIILVPLFITLFMMSQMVVRYRTGKLELKPLVHTILGMFLPLLVLGTFHLFQNWIWLNSPIAPITYAMEIDSSRWQWQFDPADLNLYRLFYPFTLTYMNSAQSMGNISPLFVGCIPFLGIKKIRKNFNISPVLGWLSLMAILTLLLWIISYFTVVEIRYVLFLWVILFLAAAQVLESIIRSAETGFTSLIQSLIIIFLAIMIVRTFLIAVITYFPHNDARQQYCEDTNLCTFLDTMNKSAAPGDRVLVLHAYRYYLRSDLFACSSQAHEYPTLVSRSQRNSLDFWVEVYRQGYRYVMYEAHLSERGYDLGNLPSLDVVPDWLNIEVLYSAPKARQLIYRLDAVNPPALPEISCKQDPEGLWKLVPSATTQR